MDAAVAGLTTFISLLNHHFTETLWHLIAITSWFHEDWFRTNPSFCVRWYFLKCRILWRNQICVDWFDAVIEKRRDLSFYWMMIAVFLKLILSHFSSDITEIKTGAQCLQLVWFRRICSGKYNGIVAYNCTKFQTFPLSMKIFEISVLCLRYKWRVIITVRLILVTKY